MSSVKTRRAIFTRIAPSVRSLNAHCDPVGANASNPDDEYAKSYRGKTTELRTCHAVRIFATKLA